MKKICRDCGLELELSEFPKAPTNKGGHSTRCKKCLSIYQIKGRRKKYPLKKRRHEGYLTGTKDWKKSCYLFAKFGVTLREYNEFLSKQNGKCKICGIPIEQCHKMLAIDHDHTTGLIRGLLCQPCNLGLGLFKDNVELLRSAINYLKIFQKRLES